jgi:hypothetical protein
LRADALGVLWYTVSVRTAPILLAILALSCGTESGDPPAPAGVPAPAGRDMRIRDVGDPTLPDHANYVDNAVAVSGATVLAVDSYDETGNGKSVGTIYVQDLGSALPYSGTSLYAPTFVPGNLRVGPGDVLDLRGLYQENQNIGTAKFAPGAVLPQLSKPTATFRLELDKQPQPIDIDVNDLADYDKGRRWLNMLVRVKNVKLYGDVSLSNLSSGRLSVELTPRTAGATACDSPFPKAPTLTNELFEAGALEIKSGTTLQSVTGIVTYFCNLHLSPRGPNDIVQ